jgi:hypothetical protein
LENANVDELGLRAAKGLAIVPTRVGVGVSQLAAATKNLSGIDRGYK